MATRIEKTDLARDALYDKVNTMIDEVNTKIDNKDSLPSQTGNTGKFLTTDGTNASWGTVKQIEIKQNLANPSADTVPSTKAVKDESSRITTLMSTKISNCITEIPQDIKLELNNGTLTLKAGSKVYVPNGKNSYGSNRFDEVIITSDMQISPSSYASSKHILCVLPNNTIQLLLLDIQQYSGSTAPSGQQFMFWYDTANNYVKYTIDSGSTWQSGWCLPLATVMVTNGTGVTSIDQVFNGFGYIGSTVFALPGVKGLIPNGRNEDGSLKNLLSINNSVYIYTLLSSETKENIPIYVKQNGSFFRAVNHIYDEKNNFNLNFGDINYCYVGTYVSYTNGKITSFTPKTVFHALDYNDSRRLESNINNKVNKYGDTMSGNLIINGNLPAYILQDSTLDLAQTFTDNRNDAFFLERDKNGKDGCFITFRHDIYDANVAELCASNGIDTNRKIQSMGIWIKKNGEYGTFAPECSFDNSIVTTISHGSNYVRFGNGLQICWGKCSPAEQTVTLPQPFKDTNYVVNMTLGPDEIDKRNDFCAVISNIITTSFRKGDRGQLWIAIGYWY